LKHTLYPSSPYDFRKMLRRPISRTSKLTWIDEESVSYACSIRIQNRSIPVFIISVGTMTNPCLDVWLPDDLLSHDIVFCLNVIRRILSTDTDMTPFTDRFFADPFLKSWLPLLLGIRPILDVDLFQSMIRIMIGQQLNVKFAEELTNRLVMTSGEHIEVQNHKLLIFPTPERIADMKYEDLQELSFSRRKAEYVIDFAKRIVSGDIDLDVLRAKEDDEVIEVLTHIRGVGRWTAECLLLFGLGRPDVMPANDIGVQNAIQKVYCLKKRPNEAS
jgi:DNA-3-methyladenine glycosylase II